MVGLAWYYRHSIIELMYRINTVWLIPGIACYLINYIFRGVRLKIYTGGRLKLINQAVHFSALHGFFSYLLPVRTGDASLPLLLKSTGKFGIKQGTGILIKMRLMDLTMLGIFSIIGALFGAREVSSQIQAIWFFSGVVLTSIYYGFRKFEKVSHYWIKRLAVQVNLSEIFKTNYSEFVITFLIWLALYASQYCLIKSLGIDLSLPGIVFISAIQFPFQILPLQGFANSGNHEGSWVAAMMMLGFTATAALEFAIASHIILLGYVLSLGIFSLVTSRI